MKRKFNSATSGKSNSSPKNFSSGKRTFRKQNEGADGSAASFNAAGKKRTEDGGERPASRKKPAGYAPSPFSKRHLGDNRKTEETSARKNRFDRQDKSSDFQKRAEKKSFRDEPPAGENTRKPFNKRGKEPYSGSFSKTSGFRKETKPYQRNVKDGAAGSYVPDYKKKPGGSRQEQGNYQQRNTRKFSPRREEEQPESNFNKPRKPFTRPGTEKRAAKFSGDIPVRKPKLEKESKDRKREGEEREKPFYSSEKRMRPPGGFSTEERPQRSTFQHRRDADNNRRSKRTSTPATKNVPEYDFKKYAARKKVKEGDQTQLFRLNRYIANAGVCSRRDADKLIEAGEIKVNGKVVTEMGYQVGRNDIVKYGNRVLNKEKLVYVLLNKPKDFITTTDDPDERKTVMDLVSSACDQRIYPVGRLDRNTTGLLLLTNDGEVAEKLSHPSNNVKKIYHVELDKPITEKDYESLVEGVELEDGKATVDNVAIVTPDATTLGIELHIGRNRIVRRIFEHLGYEVVKLDRVGYAGLTKKDVPRGKWRFLTEKEVIRLKYFI